METELHHDGRCTIVLCTWPNQCVCDILFKLLQSHFTTVSQGFTRALCSCELQRIVSRSSGGVFSHSYPSYCLERNPINFIIITRKCSPSQLRSIDASNIFYCKKVTMLQCKFFNFIITKVKSEDGLVHFGIYFTQSVV